MMFNWPDSCNHCLEECKVCKRCEHGFYTCEKCHGPPTSESESDSEPEPEPEPKLEILQYPSRRLPSAQSTRATHGSSFALPDPKLKFNKITPAKTNKVSNLSALFKASKDCKDEKDKKDGNQKKQKKKDGEGAAGGAAANTGTTKVA